MVLLVLNPVAQAVITLVHGPLAPSLVARMATAATATLAQALAQALDPTVAMATAIQVAKTVASVGSPSPSSSPQLRQPQPTAQAGWSSTATSMTTPSRGLVHGVLLVMTQNMATPSQRQARKWVLDTVAALQQLLRQCRPDMVPGWALVAIILRTVATILHLQLSLLRQEAIPSAPTSILHRLLPSQPLAQHHRARPQHSQASPAPAHHALATRLPPVINGANTTSTQTTTRPSPALAKHANTSSS